MINCESETSNGVASSRVMEQGMDDAVLLSMYRDVVRDAREATAHIAKSVVSSKDDEERFFELLSRSCAASLTLHRLSSILANLLPLEVDIRKRQCAGYRYRTQRQKVGTTREELEALMHAASEWGLLREGCEEEMKQFLNICDEKSEVSDESNT